MGSSVSVTGIVRGLSVLYRDHRKVSGGPPGGATCPGGLDGLNMGGNQPLVGWCTPPQGPKEPRVENPRGGGRLHLAWGARHPSWPPPLPSRWDLEGAGPLSPSPIYSGGFGAAKNMSFPSLLAQPYPSPSSSLAVLGEALLECHAPPPPPRRRASTGRSLPQPLPLPLLDQGTGDIIGLHVC